MKKITFFIIGLMMACVPLALHADFIGSGFYRVHCKSTSRYVSVVGEKYTTSTSCGRILGMHQDAQRK